MKLSVIIVNYNVKHFLEQCLYAVVKAAKGIETEIFVVDNNSVDGSVQLIREKFSDINIIDNKENTGFSKANNQAIKRATGEYILLLNPDTVVEEKTFSKVLDFMDKHPDAGGLGVKMIDGKGNFLPESKRGLPTPWVAFCKVFGISALFPKSKLFGQYHMGYLNENDIHEVDVLAGAFMLLRRETLEKTGLLDEAFFMYGEDIDLSYRITRAGYKNFYFPETTIIHYKGESTKKGSLNYVKVFYNAMIIFSKKHFSAGKAGLFSFLIRLAIYFRAFTSILRRLFEKIWLPIADALLIYAGFLFLTPYWENVRYEPGYYPPQFLQVAVPVYILFWLSGVALSGGYKIPVRLFKIARGLVWGSIALLLAYSLIDDRFRFSRALIVLGSVWSLFSLVAFRVLLHRIKIKRYRLNLKKTRRIAIAGHTNEVLRVQKILESALVKTELMGFIALDENDKGESYIGRLSQLHEIIRINRIDEIIFCAEDMSTTGIISAMLELSETDVDYKIAPPQSISIIGSNSINTAGDLYVINVNAITKPSNRRKKRAFDAFLALFLLLTTPFSIWLFKNKKTYFQNIVNVLNGKKSWVGYIPEFSDLEQLPKIKTGVLTPAGLYPEITADADHAQRINILYAREYSVSTDAEVFLKNWKKLDN